MPRDNFAVKSRKNNKNIYTGISCDDTIVAAIMIKSSRRIEITGELE